MKKKGVWSHVVGDLALAFLLLSVSVVCFAPIAESNATAGDLQKNVYRKGATGSDGVSLMFNVYEGTDVVYSLLDTLEQYEGKATFFIGGCWADDNVACLQEIVRRGHELGNHGYFHKDHAKLTQAQSEEEISRCNEFIRLSTGITPTLFAPPSGAYNDGCLKAASSLEMKTVLWSKDTIDWRDKDTSLVVSRATNNIQGGDFVLMHPKAVTAQALGEILQTYRNKNLRVISVSENLQFGG